MRLINELRDLLTTIGIDKTMAKECDPDQRIAGRILESVDYPAFLVAIEEHFGVTIDDRYSLRLGSLNDFAEHIRNTR